MLRLFHLLGDFAFLGGILMQLYAYLSPVPWFSNDPNNALLQFYRKLRILTTIRVFLILDYSLSSTLRLHRPKRVSSWSTLQFYHLPCQCVAAHTPERTIAEIQTLR